MRKNAANHELGKSRPSRSIEITQDKPTTPTKSIKRILLAEDLPDLREAIKLVLLDQGYAVQAANDGQEAVTVFSEFDPDLVILDMRMPKLNGEDACAEIRKVSNVPIIMFTSTNDAPAVKKAIRKGATDFVLKSSGMAALTERIAFHLKSQNKKAPAKPAPAGPQKTVAVAGGEIRSTVLIIEPDEKNRELIKSVVVRLKQNAVEVATAEEAIAAFKQHRPHIVITEWSLPDMDAFNMLTKLKPTRRIKAATKIMMSKRLSPEAHRKAQFVGIKKFVDKPLTDYKVDKIVADSVRNMLRILKASAAKAA